LLLVGSVTSVLAAAVVDVLLQSPDEKGLGAIVVTHVLFWLNYFDSHLIGKD